MEYIPEIMGSVHLAILFAGSVIPWPQEPKSCSPGKAAPTFPAQKFSEPRLWLSSCSGEAVGAVVSPGEATFRYPISEGCEGDRQKEESWLSASPSGFAFCRAFRAPRGSGRSRGGKLEINFHFLSFCGLWVTLTQHL